MLHIVNEGNNSQLKGHKYPLGKELAAKLQKHYQSHLQDKGEKGFERLENVIRMDNEEGGINYNEMTQLKHIFDKISPKSKEFEIMGGNLMKTWVEVALNGSVNRLKDGKHALKNAGVENAFIRKHEKNRNTKSKQKPTTAKFNTSNVSQAISDNNAISFNENKKIEKSNIGEQTKKKTVIITEKQYDILQQF